MLCRFAFSYLLLGYLIETICESITSERKDKVLGHMKINEVSNVEPVIDEKIYKSSILLGYDEIDIREPCSFDIDYLDPNHTTWIVDFSSSSYSIWSTYTNSSGLMNNQSDVCSVPIENKDLKSILAVHDIFIEDNSTINRPHVLNYVGPGNKYVLKPSKSPGQIKKCILHQKIINQEKVFVPIEVDSIEVNYQPELEYSGKSHICEFTFRDISIHTAGMWEITTYFIDPAKSNNTIFKQKDTMHLILIAPLVPHDYVVGRTGQYKILSPPTNHTENGTCFYFFLKDDISSFWEKSIVLKGNEKWFQPYGNCRLRVSIHETFRILMRQVFTWTGRDMDFSIIEDNTVESITKYYKHLKTGSNYSFDLDSFEHIKCDLVKPDDQILKLNSPQCNYTLNNVSDADSGIWKARYHQVGMILIEEHYDITVWEPKSARIIINKTENAIDFTCRTLEKFNNCAFQKFGGIIIKDQSTTNYDPGYFENIFEKNPSEEQVYECGLRILSPSPEDYGQWKCLIEYEGFYMNHTFTLEQNIERIEQSKSIESNGESYLQIGEKFQVNCPFYKLSKYCLIISPDGIKYSVSNRKTIQNIQQKTNNEISINDYGITVNHADLKHEGHWIREFLYEKNTYMQTITRVKVLYVQATSNFIADKNSTSLQCKLLSASTALTCDCLWIRPDGYNISESNSTYFTTKNNNCYLELHALNPKEQGIWTCYAKPQNEVNKTFSGIVEVNTKTESMISSTTTNNIIASTLFTTTSIAIYTSPDSITTLNVSSTTVSSLNAPTRKIFMSETNLIPTGKNIYHCEWIHPNGSHLIKNDSTIDKSKYIFTQTNSQCKLELNYWNNEDYGSWQYCIYLSKNSTEKVCNKLDFFENSEDGFSPLWWIIPAVVIIIICLTLVGLYYYKLYKKKKPFQSIESIDMRVRFSPGNIYI